jgi:transketolase
MTATTPILERAPFGAILQDIGRRHDDAVVLIGDLGRYVDVEAFAQAFPARFLQMGMSEANIVGTASGLAKTNLMPIVVTYGVFITRRAYDQVAMALTTGPTRAALVGFMPGITAPFRATHQAIDDIALMRALPNMTVVDPADAIDLEGALDAACALDRPLYVRGYRGVQPPLAGRQAGGFALGASVELSAVGDVAFVSSGLASQWVVEAAAELSSRGVTSAHLHVPTVKPLDEEGIVEFCARHRVVVCVENHSTIGGLGEAVAATLAEQGIGARIIRAGVRDAWPPSGALPYIRGQLGLDAAGLADLAETTR